MKYVVNLTFYTKVGQFDMVSPTKFDTHKEAQECIDGLENLFSGHKESGSLGARMSAFTGLDRRLSSRSITIGKEILHKSVLALDIQAVSE